MKERGFSLLETLVVVSIVLIVAAIGVIYYSSQRANNAVTVSTQIVAADLKLAKDTASTAPGGAELDLGVPVAGGNALVLKSSGVLVRQDVLPLQVQVQTSWGNNAVVFRQNGTVASFAATGVITIYHTGASASRQIQVDPNTGAILQ